MTNRLTESRETIDNSGLLRVIEAIVRNQNGYGRVIVGGKGSLTISVETHQASSLHPHDRTKQLSEVIGLKGDKILIDQKTVDVIAELTGSDEIRRIFVGSHPFWATIISTSLATGSSCAMWMHGIQIVSPTINPLEKVAPCCLCSTVEERTRRVDEDRKHPIPVDQVETGEPPTAPLSGASSNPQPTPDFIEKFRQRVAAESVKAARNSSRTPDTTPTINILELRAIKDTLKRLEEELRSSPYKDYGKSEKENFYRLLYGRNKAAQIIMEILQFLSRRQQLSIQTNTLPNKKTPHVSVPITEELTPLVLRIAAIIGCEQRVRETLAQQRKHLLLMLDGNDGKEPIEKIDSVFIS